MTVAEFIVWLQGVEDQGATVQVVRHTSGKGWDDQGGNATIVDFSPHPSVGLFDYDDFRGHPYIKPNQPDFNRRTLLLGEHNG